MGDRDQTMETTEVVTVRPTGGADRQARASVRIDFAAISDPGKVRTNNEDHYLINRLGRTFGVVATNMPPGSLPDPVDEVAYGMVVADGMGGMAAGEKASQLAIRTGVDLVLNSGKWATRIDDLEARQLIGRMRDYFHKVDSVVIGQARNDRQLNGMGTTLTLAYIVNTDVFIVHVGDSRAYLCRQGKLEQLTRDHTMAQGLADLGAIKPEEVHRHAKRHVLTNFVGGPSSGVEPEVATLHLQDGDTLLLCSDGLTEMVEDQEITRVLANSGTSDAAAKALVDLALEAGGKDNVTVLVARIEIPRAG
jgi:serine/threonine protein phosphatase PrpC